MRILTLKTGEPAMLQDDVSTMPSRLTTRTGIVTAGAQPKPNKPINPGQAAVSRTDIPSVTQPLDYDLLGMLAQIPARLSVYDMLRLSPQIRKALVTALTEAEAYLAHVVPTKAR